MSEVAYALRGEEIVKRFGAVTALDGVALTLKPGEILGVLGDNGAGKSTLIKILTGFHQQTSGKLFIGGRNAASLRRSCPVAWHRVRVSGSGAGEFAKHLSQHVPESGNHTSRPVSPLEQSRHA